MPSSQITGSSATAMASTVSLNEREYSHSNKEVMTKATRKNITTVQQALHHVIHDLGEADDLDVDVLVGKLGADRFELFATPA